MRRFLTVAVAAALVALCSSAYAGQIWTDGNGDGLPDGQLPIANPSPSTNVTVGVWIDAQSFTWTNFLAYIEWSGDCISYVSASYVISGGSNFPIDNFSHPRAIGFGGSGFNQGGVDQIGNAVLHINTPVSCCVSPIIDIYNPYYVFSQLGAGSAYQLFTTNPGTCYGPIAEPTGACCFPDFSCQIITASACIAGGGNYLGDDTLCSACPPPPQREACCFPDGSCVEADFGACPTGSIGQGAGTNCSPNLCPPPAREACCFPDGSCVDANVGQCPAGSVGQGSGTNCSPNLCPPPPGQGACCFSDFTCQILTAAGCEAAGGTYQGDGSDCSVCPLPPELGACCLPSGGCLEGATRDQCNASGGTFYPNTPCSQVDCTTAVESKSWGNIKGLYR